jgi:hypothetical protein
MAKNSGKNYEIVSKATSFNVKDPDQLKMLEHANKRKNFSAYIKRLIQRDMEGAMPVFVQAPSQAPIQEESEMDFNPDLMLKML